MYKSIKELFTAIADVIRERLGIEGKIPTQDIPNRVLDLFFTGFTQGRETGEKTGYTQGLAKGKEQGKQAQYDEFWDAYQWDGTRTYYHMYGFGQGAWSFDNFYPKYDIKPNDTCQYLFYGWINYKNYTDYPAVTGSLKKRLEECGVVLDTSKATLIRSMFAFTRFTEIPTIDCTGLTDSSTSDNIFSNNSQLVTIEKIIVAEYVKIERWFDACPALENLTIEGTIGQDGFNVQWSTKLSKASIISIITHLSDTASGKSITISKTAVNNGFETSSGAADGSTSEEWVTLITAKSNWTINLIDA